MEPTGIKVLDEILMGGLPRPSAVGIIGRINSGKSWMAKQIAVNLLQRDYRVLYYAIDESGDDCRDSLYSLGEGVDKAIEESRLALVDMFALGVERLAESLPTEEPEKIAETNFKFSDLIAQGRSFTLKHLGKKQLVIMDSLTPMFLLVESKKVFQFGQVLKYATRFAKAIGLATMHTNVLGELTENAMISFADVIIELEGNAPGGSSRAGIMRLAKIGKLPVPNRNYYYEITPQGIMISTAVIG